MEVVNGNEIPKGRLDLGFKDWGFKDWGFKTDSKFELRLNSATRLLRVYFPYRTACGGRPVGIVATDALWQDSLADRNGCGAIAQSCCYL